MSVPGKYLVAAVLSCLFLPSLCFANSTTDFSNGGGTLAGSNAGLSLSGSILTAVNGFNGGGLVTGDLGTVSFTTGALIGGSLQMGGLLAGGGTFTITGDGMDGIPSGVLFTGTFTGDLTWTLTTLANGTHDYTLTGVLSGVMGTTAVDGVTVQLTINTGKGFFNGSTTISGGNTSITPTPEPSALALFGTGILGLAGVMRRRANSKQK